MLSSLNGWALLLKISGVLWVDDYSTSVLKPAVGTFKEPAPSGFKSL